MPWLRIYEVAAQLAQNQNKPSKHRLNTPEVDGDSGAAIRFGPTKSMLRGDGAERRIHDGVHVRARLLDL
jgi:hypothetical protein